MTYVFSSTLDEELDRYINAEEALAANVGSNLNNTKKVYNVASNSNDYYTELLGGGNVKVHEQPLTKLEDAEKYNQSLLDQGITPTADDFYAAGFDDKIINEGGFINVQPKSGITEPLTEEVQQQAFDLGFDVVSPVDQPIFEGSIKEIIKGLVRGGITNPAQFLENLDTPEDSKFDLSGGIGFQLFNPETGEFDPAIKILSGNERDEINQKIKSGELPYAINLESLTQIDEASGGGAKVLGSFAQFAGAYAGLGKFFRLGKSRTMQGFTGGAAADFLGFEGDEGRISDIIYDLGEAFGVEIPQNVIVDFMQTDPTDPDYVGRFKNALEGGVIGVIAEPILMGLGKTFRMLKDGDITQKQVLPFVKAARENMRTTFAQQVENANNRIADEGNTLYSNPITPLTDRMISMIGKLVREPEKNIINTAFPDQQASEAVQAQVAAQKNNYPAKDGWLQEGMEVANVKQKKDKVEVTYKEVPYNFHIPPENVDLIKWQNTIKRKTVNEIKNLANRAAQGDPAAKAIIEQANWYRAMRARMRQEFGGLGDLFADLLGTTSAQTGVTQNFDNAVEIMRRFSRGEFDNEIRMYEEMLAKGDTSPIKLGQMHNDPNSPFKLITKASGSLFNANSPASTRALLDLFRSAKGSPKTPNFTGNLIGYTNAATVDVWAARFLRRMSGQKRLPPPVEKGVSGKHMVGSTLADPKVGGEFGFGQRVIQDAVNEINKKGFIKNVAPDIGEMGADDLQAVLWFLEKEIWTKKGWTSKAGEGGSLDYEASLAGAADQSKIKSNREIINTKFKPPNKRKKETDEQYAARVKQAQEADAAAKVAAQEEINAAAAPLVRYVLGISVERPGARPTNVEQANVAARLGEPAKQDETVAMYGITNSYGRFMQSDERAFNAEFVVRENFDPTALTRRMVEVAKDADQDAAFISKIVPERTADSRPGVEIYFRNRQDADYARDLSDELTKYNVDGFTFITDARVSDQPSRQAGMNEEAIAGLTGIRFQYIPEFDMGADAWNAMSAAEKAAKLDEIEVIYANIILDLNRQNADISTAIITHNETNVIGRDGYDAILGTTSE